MGVKALETGMRDRHYDGATLPITSHNRNHLHVRVYPITRGAIR